MSGQVCAGMYAAHASVTAESALGARTSTSAMCESPSGAVRIVAGPRTDFFPPEIDALKKYLDKSGKLLLEIDPPEKPDSQPLTNLIALSHDWGIDVEVDLEASDEEGTAVLRIVDAGRKD